ncbi:MAG: MJ1255/VC2487 family glycosyltransferase [Polyangiaceae bacterium]|jgi:uncharacterized protein (TIGR00661 family)
MRILYGVVGEGMGHATRSKVVCEHLVASGHDVKIVVSGRAHAFLAKAFPDVVEIRGLSIRYVDNRLDRNGTLARNVLAAPSMIAANIGAYFDKVAPFRPELVISDFDSFAYLYAKRHRLPIFSIDNQQIISRCKLGKFAKTGVQVDYEMTKAFVRAKLPSCDYYVITSFFFPPIRRRFHENTTVVPPIVRPSIVDAKSRSHLGAHVLVYQTSSSDEHLLDRLEAVRDQHFLVYGRSSDVPRKNCELRAFSEEAFVRDLAAARAVVCNGGLSLIGEAVYLGKPIMSIPVHNQFEQVANARYVEELEYGLAADSIDADLLRLFLREAPKYASRVALHRQDGNRELFDTVDDIVDRFKRRPGRKRSERTKA